MTGGGLSAVPDFGFAGACLVTWFRPTAFGDRVVHHIAMVMLLEFFVVHSVGPGTSIGVLARIRRCGAGRVRTGRPTGGVTRGSSP